MNSQFRLGALLADLIAHLDGDQGRRQYYLDFLSKPTAPTTPSRTTPTSAFSTVEKIASNVAQLQVSDENSEDPSDVHPEWADNFKLAYERLKTKQIRELDPFLQFLLAVHEDPDVAAGVNARAVLPVIDPSTLLYKEQLASKSIPGSPSRIAKQLHYGSVGNALPPPLASGEATPRPKKSFEGSLRIHTAATNPSATSTLVSPTVSFSPLSTSSGPTSSRPGTAPSIRFGFGEATVSKSQSVGDIHDVKDKRLTGRFSETHIRRTPSPTFDGATLANTASGRTSASSKMFGSRVGSSKPRNQSDDRFRTLQSPLKSRPRLETLSMASPRSAHPPIGSQPIAQQQTWIIEDILFVLMGIDGKYITRAESVSPYQCEFVVDPSLDISLSDLVIRIFPLARSFVIIEHFIETHSRFEYGRVNHALCRAMKSLTKEYMILLAQLEHEAHQSPEFGLHQLWFHVSPTLQTMTTLSSLIEAILLTESVGRDDVTTMALFHELHSSTRGGGVLLGVIADRMLSLSGDNSTKLLYSHLLSESAVPYFEMLRQWINRGEICDPYDEFMIQEQRGMSKEQLKDDFNDLYWDQRYVLRMDAVPNFLDPFKEKILLAGKYLNVVRECATTSNGTHFLEQRWREETKKYQESKNGGSSSGMVSGDVSRAIEGGRWADDIDLAYRFANETLLCMLVQEQELIPRLSSLKHYFFLDQSDWLTHFFDLALPELSKPSNKVGVEKVSSLLELVLRNPSSASSSDPYKDDVVIELSTISLAEHLLTVSTITGANSREQFMEGQHERIQRANLKSDQQLSGIESFMLGYTVRFPLSLVLGKKYLIKYQLIFRHLFHCKYVERLLCGLWFDQTSFHRISRAKSRPSRAAAAENDSSESAESREESMLFMARLGALRTKMVHCVQQVLYYSCFEVLEPQWLNLEKTIKKATTVDEVLKLHMDFLDTCLKECTLTNQSLVKIFSEFMETCVSFTEFCKWYMMLRHGSGTREGETELPPPPKGTFSSRSSTLATLEKYETQTMAQIRELLKTLKYVATLETASLADLATRMDYNQYYSRQPVFSSAAGLSSSAFLRAEVQRAGGGSSSRQGFKRQRSGLELGQARSAGRRNPQANTGEDLMDLE